MPVNVFVSYSEDDQLAVTLVGTLRNNPEVRLFIADDFRTPGMSIQQKVNRALGQCDVFLLLWTERSQESKWVAYEIQVAQELGKRILPVLVEDVPLPEAINDIEAVPLYRDPRRGMQWLFANVARLDEAGSSGSRGFNWSGLMKAGVAAAIGLAAWWSDSASKAADEESPRRAGRKRKRTKGSKASKA